MTGVEVVEGELDREALQYAFGQLVGRHEVLRTVFREDEVGEVRQYVLDAGGGWVIGYRDLREEALWGEMAEALVQGLRVVLRSVEGAAGADAGAAGGQG